MAQKQTKTGTGLEIKRKERESVGSLMRRFNQRVRSSGLLMDARKYRFKTNEPNRIARRKSALVRAQDRKRYQEMRKMGTIK